MKATFSARRSTLIALVGGMSVQFLSNFMRPEHQIYYNASDSAPRGWYARVPAHDLSQNTWVFARLPSDAAKVADQRGYLPISVPILKQIGASAGQRVCVKYSSVFVDDAFVASVRSVDGAGRPMVGWQGCRKLVTGELFLLNRSSDVSYDSRYFGPILIDGVIGNAVPLWTR